MVDSAARLALTGLWVRNVVEIGRQATRNKTSEEVPFTSAAETCMAFCLFTTCGNHAPRVWMLCSPFTCLHHCHFKLGVNINLKHFPLITSLCTSHCFQNTAHAKRNASSQSWSFSFRRNVFWSVQRYILYIMRRVSKDPRKERTPSTRNQEQVRMIRWAMLCC
jgi:hypothetical protein